MPAVSKQQQKFMGMVHAIHKGEIEPSEVSPEMQKVSKTMKKKDAKDFASTKHKGLPVKVPKKKTEAIQPSTATGYIKDGVVQFTGSKKVALQKMKADKKKNPSSKYQLVDTISKKVGDKIKTEGCKKMKKMNEGEDKALVKQGLKYAKKKYKYDANDLKHLAKELLVYMRSGEISDQASMEAYLDYRHDPRWDEGADEKICPETGKTVKRKHKGFPEKYPKNVGENTLTDLPTEVEWGYTKDGVVQCVASKNTCVTRMESDRERNPGSKFQLVYAPDLTEGEEYIPNPIKEAIRPIVREMLNEAKTADENYKDKVKQIDHAIKLIQQQIKKHIAKQQKDPENWGLPGDLGYVIEQLQEIIQFMKTSK